MLPIYKNIKACKFLSIPGFGSGFTWSTLDEPYRSNTAQAKVYLQIQESLSTVKYTKEFNVCTTSPNLVFLGDMSWREVKMAQKMTGTA